MKINWKKHAVFSLLQTCTSSMAAGVQLTVRMTDSFIIEDTRGLKVRLIRQDGGNIERKLVFDHGKAVVDMNQLAYGSYTLTIVYDDGTPLTRDAEENSVYKVDGTISEYPYASFQLTDGHGFCKIETELRGKCGILTIHVLESDAQGQRMPSGDTVYQYEFVGKRFRQWVELNSCNNYETTVELPQDMYTLHRHNETSRMIFDDSPVTDSFEIAGGYHSFAVIETVEKVPDLDLKVFVMDEKCVLTTPKDCYFQVKVSGPDYAQTISLNEMNDFSSQFFDLPLGTYTITAHQACGYKVLYEVDGETCSECVFDLENNGLNLNIDIIYQREDMISRPSLRIRKLIKGESGCLMPPESSQSFSVSVCGCQSTHSFYLSSENCFCAELACLCPGIYQIEEQDNPDYLVSYQLSDGTPLIDGRVIVDGCEGLELWIINEHKNSGKLQICKYVEDENGNLTSPQAGECFAVRLHSFAYQEVLMLKEENDYCVALEQLPKGCYDIREVQGYHVLYSVDQGEWSNTARIVIDDGRMHEVRILNLRSEQCGTIRIEKWMENERCVLMHPNCTDSFEVCVSGSGVRKQITLSAQNQWCAYIEGLAYGQYRIEELYESDVRYLVNGEPCEEAIVMLGREMQEVKIINAAARCSSLRLAVCMVNCEHQQMHPEAEFEAIAVIEGDNFCKEVRLNYENRWRALITGLQGECVRITQKDTMGYHVLYQIDGQIAAEGLVTLDGRTHDVLILDHYHCRSGALWIEKVMVDECGVQHHPSPSDRFEFSLRSTAVEIPFVLNAANGFSVCFEDLEKGSYEIIEHDASNCCYRVNHCEQTEGKITVGSEDVHVQVVNLAASLPKLHIACYAEGEQCCCTQIRFALVGQGLHEIYTLSPQEDALVIEGLKEGTYEILTDQECPVVYEINGRMHEKGVFTIDREDVYIILICKESCIQLKLQKCIYDEDRERMFVPTEGSYEIFAEGENGCRKILLNASNQYSYTLFDVPSGMMRVWENDDQEASVIVNGEQTTDGTFNVESGCYDVRVVSAVCKRQCLAISASCMTGDEYHECRQQELNLKLIGREGETKIVLNAANHFHWDEQLKQGKYTLVAENQNICFYSGPTQSYNAITFEVKNDPIQVQAVLNNANQNCVVSFEIEVRDENDNIMEIPAHSVFTVRTVSKSFFETLVFNDDNKYKVTRIMPKDQYEMFVKGQGDVIYDYALVNGRKKSVAEIELDQDTDIIFVFRKKTVSQGTLYIQGYRQDLDCDCLKTPGPDSVFRLRLSGPETKEVYLNQGNRWRKRLDDLPEGTYTIDENGEEQYSYIVDGREDEKAVIHIQHDAHNVKVICESETSKRGTLILDLWLWDGYKKRKPEDEDFWVNVDHESGHWELVLNKGNHWQGMIEHLENGAYQLRLPEQENVLYQMNGNAPSGEGTALINGGECHVDILCCEKKNRTGCICLEKRNVFEGKEQSPNQGEYKFILSRPGYNEQIVLNANNSYRARISDLQAGCYVLYEEDSEDVTYRINGGSEVRNAVIDMEGDDAQVVALNHVKTEQEAATLSVVGFDLNQEVVIKMQNAENEYWITLNEENRYRQLLSDIPKGIYTMDAHPENILYQLDGQSQRPYCTLRIDGDSHDVMISIDTTDTVLDNQKKTGSMKFSLWSKNDNGLLRPPLQRDSMEISIIDPAGKIHTVVLNADQNFTYTLQDLVYGSYRIRCAKEGKVKADGGMEQDDAEVIVNDMNTHIIDVILKRETELDHHMTRLIL